MANSWVDLVFKERLEWHHEGGAQWFVTALTRLLERTRRFKQGDHKGRPDAVSIS